jgi:Holliday junction resolvase RusA-like endonuclease
MTTSTSKGSYRVRLDVAPIPCPRPRFARNGGVYYPKRYTTWRDRVAYLMKDEDVCEPTDDPWYVTMVFHCLRPKRGERAPWPPGDVDNYVKAVLDAIQGKWYMHDDKQVMHVSASKMWADKASIELTLLKVSGGLDDNEE